MILMIAEYTQLNSVANTCSLSFALFATQPARFYT